VVLVSFRLLAIPISSHLTRYLGLVLVSHLTPLSCNTYHLGLSFKWVEASKYGGGGPNWVEVQHSMTFTLVNTVSSDLPS